MDMYCSHAESTVVQRMAIYRSMVFLEKWEDFRERFRKADQDFENLKTGYEWVHQTVEPSEIVKMSLNPLMKLLEKRDDSEV